jgi:protein-S-isoprenylcysteine O-methyltransferase Ste14
LRRIRRFIAPRFCRRPWVPTASAAKLRGCLTAPAPSRPLGVVSFKTRAFLNAVVSVPIVCLLIFLPAGTFAYWQAWAFLAVSSTCGSLMSAYFWRKDRSLLERRMRIAEKQQAQKVIVSLLYSLLVVLVVVSALDHRLRWSAGIPLLAILGNLIVVAGFSIYFVVLRENRFAGSTIEVSSDQKVISTGPYSIVRHPLYVGLVVLSAGIALALGSYWALVLLVPLVGLVVWRLRDEEAYLIANLPGYAEYRARVRWALIPGIF